MHGYLILLLLSGAGLASAQHQMNAMVIDGELGDAFWEHVQPGALAPAVTGTPPDTGGEVRAIVSGRYLYVGAHLPEPSGRLTARSIGKNPHWEDEDTLSFVVRVANENDWMVQVGPLGAYSVKW